MFELRTHRSIRDFGEADWRRLTGDDPPPFLSFEWLDALEQTGCVRPERGWLPVHLSLRKEGELVAGAPAYLKGNSEGEFVFDHAFAHFAEDRLGIAYFPKLIVAVPFTPATGPRLLVAPGADASELTQPFVGALARVIEELDASGVHVLFPPTEQADALADMGMAHRCGVQFHWRNRGYGDFDDFLSRFNSKRRNQIRRERRELDKQGSRIEIVTGSDFTPEVVDFAFQFYLSTVDKFIWGRQYLNRHFFEEVCSTMPDKLHLVIARDGGSGRRIAGAFNLMGGGAMYGRYWGALQDRRCLHFNVCYYAGIEECIRRGLQLFEPGAGGEHKVARGFEPTVTHSLHLFRDPRLDAAARDYMARERDAIRGHVASEPSVLKD